MSLFDDKYNNQNNRKSMGDDLLDGIGSALPFAKEMSEKITGHTIEGDMKMLKGFSDAECAEMSTAQLMKLKRTYRFRMILSIVAAVGAVIAGISKLFSGDYVETGTGGILIVVGVVAFLLSVKEKKQCKLIDKYLDVDK